MHPRTPKLHARTIGKVVGLALGPECGRACRVGKESNSIIRRPLPRAVLRITL
jgi:hypothetical protein